jgi:hypothetical protein
MVDETEHVIGAQRSKAVRERIARPIEQLEALDPFLEPLQKAVQTVVPQQSALKDVLSGTWLGEPLHPPLTDVVIGT